jgi:hypothetical protein
MADRGVIYLLKRGEMIFEVKGFSKVLKGIFCLLEYENTFI